MTRYPGIAEYNQAAQNPSTAFADPELATGTLATSGLGLPIVLGGGFALTYTVTSGTGTSGTGTSGSSKFAVRCFHRYVPDLKQRYAQISDVIGGLRSEHFVSFEYQREGVRVRSARYPVVKMAWAEGSTLGGFIEDNYTDDAAMRRLSSSFRDLARFLADRKIAHGDLENGNVVVRKDGFLTLIDYDGMYVPGMALGNGNELGHAHFQHPGRTPDHFGPNIDDFSFILIDLSLDAIARDPSLYERFCNGDNILFQKSDFENPKTSPAFQELRRLRPMADKIDDFASICQRPIEQVPSLQAFLARHATPVPAAGRSATRPDAGWSRPDGVSNLDYIRSALGRSGPVALPSTSASALTDTGPDPSGMPVSDQNTNSTSILSNAAIRYWSWWAEATVVALILLLILAKL